MRLSLRGDFECGLTGKNSRAVMHSRESGQNRFAGFCEDERLRGQCPSRCNEERAAFGVESKDRRGDSATCGEADWPQEGCLKRARVP